MAPGGQAWSPALDALDELRVGLLAGTLDQGIMLWLKAVAADLHDASGDERLDAVLAEIDLQVAVGRPLLAAPDFANCGGIFLRCKSGGTRHHVALRD